MRQEKIDTLINLRSVLTSEFAAIAHLGLGTPVGAGHANFIVLPILNIESKEPDSKRALSIYKILAEDMGVVVRFRGNEVHCKGCIRVTIGTPEENNYLIQRLEKALTDL